MVARRLRAFLVLAVTGGVPLRGRAGALHAALPAGGRGLQPAGAGGPERWASAPRQAARIAERRRGYGTEGPVLYRTAPIAAPARFDLVGVAGELHALEFRAREDGGEWSAWVESRQRRPGLHRRQRRGAGAQPRGPDRGPAPLRERERRHDARRESAHPAAKRRQLRRGRRVRLRAGDRLLPTPNFIGRREWGANRNKRRLPAAEAGRVRQGQGRRHPPHGHHQPLHRARGAAGSCSAICRYHRNGNGWNDIGYNALVDRFGNVYAGRAGGMGKPVVGAHAEGHNSQTTGVATIADHQTVPATKRRAAGGRPLSRLEARQGRARGASGTSS